MTEEKEPRPNKEVAKLTIAKPSDFRFQAAYLAYSQTWDKIASEEEKTKLNEITLSLSEGEISYSDFYKRLDLFRRPGSKHYAYSRERIETQRKRDWRKKQTKNMRNARHR